MKKLLFLSLAFSFIFLAACTTKTEEKVSPATPESGKVENGQSESPAANVGMANPASVNCDKQGGKLKIVTKADGGQYGICYFMDNRQCEEWALLRGACPVGGLKVTGYENEQQVYCAITGGEVNVQKKICLSNSQECGLEEYYSGDCPK
jgi:putative hemolysin